MLIKSNNLLRKYLKDRTYVFVDAANVYYSQRTLKWKFGYQEFVDFLHASLDIRRMYFYSSLTAKNMVQVKFFKKVESMGFVVRSKEVKLIQVESNVFERKGNLDVELAVDLIKEINNFDSCILVSGDSDFAILVDEMKKLKKRVVVLSTKGHISRELIERAKYIDIKKFRKYFEYQE